MKVKIETDDKLNSQIFKLIFTSKEDYDNLYNALSKITGLLKQDAKVLNSYKKFLCLLQQSECNDCNNSVEKNIYKQIPLTSEQFASSFVIIINTMMASLDYTISSFTELSKIYLATQEVQKEQEEKLKIVALNIKTTNQLLDKHAECLEGLDKQKREMDVVKEIKNKLKL